VATVSVFFAETRPLAEEWTFRYLGAALAEHVAGSEVEQRLAALAEVSELRPAPPTPAQVRAWAHEQGMAVSAMGRVPAQVLLAYQRAHGVDRPVGPHA
jgi:hypothetical protein